MVLLSRKKISLCFACLLVVFFASAQNITNVVAASFSEKVNADVWVFQIVNGVSKKMAEYRVFPASRDFMFAIPTDSAIGYRLQINLMKPDGRHLKLQKVLQLPLALHHDHS